MAYRLLCANTSFQTTLCPLTNLSPVLALSEHLPASYPSGALKEFALEPNDPGISRSLLSKDEQKPLVTQLDPDALTRQGSTLEPHKLTALHPSRRPSAHSRILVQFSPCLSTGLRFVSGQRVVWKDGGLSACAVLVWIPSRQVLDTHLTMHLPASYPSGALKEFVLLF
jgi:hypothetical protein